MKSNQKALVATTVASTIDQFCMGNIRMLQQFGYQVEVAANFQKGSTTSDTRMREFREELSEMGVTVHDVGFQRSVTSLDNVRAYRCIRHIVRSGGYQLIHCHTPVGAMLVRLAADPSAKKAPKSSIPLMDSIFSRARQRKIGCYIIRWKNIARDLRTRLSP